MKTSILCFVLFSTFLTFSQNNPFKNIKEDAKGYVGIGTSNPDAMLTVKGTIHTREVLVDLEGAVAPDYVFEKYFLNYSTLNPKYEFLSLSEIEEFIKKNHHLPKIPSASDLSKNGLSLKEMNLLLLEKIEELTLHTLEQQKQIDRLSKILEMYINE